MANRGNIPVVEHGASTWIAVNVDFLENLSLESIVTGCEDWSESNRFKLVMCLMIVHALT
jgi:hypothetical protein